MKKVKGVSKTRRDWFCWTTGKWSHDFTSPCEHPYCKSRDWRG
jgi:hypothetical protein